MTREEAHAAARNIRRIGGHADAILYREWGRISSRDRNRILADLDCITGSGGDADAIREYLRGLNHDPTPDETSDPPSADPAHSEMEVKLNHWRKRAIEAESACQKAGIDPRTGESWETGGIGK